MDGNSLIPLESVNAIELFTGKSLDDLLTKIRQETATIVPDVSTDKGRKEIASLAYKVARSKTTIDDAGKTLVADWKAKSAEVDAARKKARDYLDSLKDEVRAPLTEWEAEQERVKQAAIEAERLAIERAEAERRAELQRKEEELREREAAVERAENERRSREAAEQAERDRAAREEQIRKDAAAKAERDAAEAVARAQREADEAKERERAAAERAERERVEAIERAEREKQEAIRQAEARARQEAEDRERQRAAEEARIKADEAARAADREHRKTINLAAVAAFEKNGITADLAKQVITLIASGSIPAVSIRY